MTTTAQNPAPASPATGEKSGFSTVTVLAMLFSTAGLFVLIALFVSNQGAFPANESAEAGFARDMILHHSQAVDMGMMLYDRTQNETLKSIAIDIVLTQQNQVGQMQGWLDLWGLTYSGSALPMTWMGTPVTGLMPGMAAPEQMDALRSATGEDADRLFIEMMIPHHQGGLHMAQAVLSRTTNASVIRLARSIIDSQQREIEELTKLGEQVGAQVVPLELHEGSH